MLAKLVVGVASGILAGVLVGAAARAGMRLVALSIGQPTGFTWSGTQVILVLFVILTVPGAVLAAFVRGRWRWPLLLASTALLCVMAAGVARSDLEAVGPLSSQQLIATIASMAALFASILALPLITVRLVAAGLRRLHPARSRLAVG